MRTITIVWAASATLLAASAQVRAQDPISPDRPGFANGPGTVAPGALQIEGGFQWDDAGDAVVLPLALLRYGVGERTEVRAAWSGITVDGGDTDALGGAVEVKHTLTDGANGATGLLASVAIPADGGALDPSLGFLWTREFGGPVSLFGTATVGAPSAGGDRKLQGTNAIGVSIVAGARTGFFVEHFVSVTEGASENVQFLDGGITYLLRPDLQVDINGGVSVGEADAGSFLGGGLSYRF